MKNRNFIEVQWSVFGVRELAEERNACLAQCNVVVKFVEDFELEIFLRMNKGKLRVGLMPSPSVPPNQLLAVEWGACLVSANGERWKCRPLLKEDIHPRASASLNQMVVAKSADLLDHEKEIFFEGLARLSVRIRPTASNLNNPCTYFTRSKVGVSREITWKVEDFSSIGSSNGDDDKWLYLLPKVSLDESQVQLKMRLFLQEEEAKLCIGVYPCISFDTWNFCGMIMDEVSIMRFDGSKEECWKREEANAGIPRDSTIDFVEKQKLLDDRKNLLPGDVLTLYVKFRDFNSYSMCSARVLEGVNPAFPILSPDPQMESTSSLSHDLDAFLESGEHSDFTLRVGREAFPVLRSVLCARSAVFRAMLGSPAWLESARKSMDVPDFGPDPVRRMVRYIYSDRVPERMDAEDAAELYAIADKYALPGLRAHCARFLTSDLRVGTACLALRLAERHSDADLKAKVGAYISAHQRAVFLSPEWAEVMKEDAQLALEIHHELCLKRFKST